MEASTPAEDAAPAVVAAPEAVEPKAPEPIEAEEKPAAAAGLLNIDDSKLKF